MLLSGFARICVWALRAVSRLAHVSALCCTDLLAHCITLVGVGCIVAYCCLHAPTGCNLKMIHSSMERHGSLCTPKDLEVGHGDFRRPRLRAPRDTAHPQLWLRMLRAAVAPPGLPGLTRMRHLATEHAVAAESHES